MTASRWADKDIDLQDILGSARRASETPGCAVAVYERGKIHTAVSGYADALERIPVNPNTAFQIGSITKPFTATLIMQLVHEGKLSLQDKLIDLLPELVLRDADLSAQVTVWHLLSHTSGIDGDLVVETGEEDDYLEKAVAASDGTAFVHPPGALFSYCNLGYILLGRTIEKICERSFDSVLEDRIFSPLNLTSATTRVTDLDAGCLARGHEKKDGEWSICPLWPRSNTPCGSRLAMPPGELVTFAAAHFAKPGLLLTEPEIAHMQQPAVAMASKLRCSAWGLGWMRFDWSDQNIFGHDGGVTGNAAFLRIAPDADFAVALATNGGNYAHLYDAVLRPVLKCFLDIKAPPPPPTVNNSLTPSLKLLIGRFERRGLFADITLADGSLYLRSGGELGDPNEPMGLVLPADDNLFLVRLPNIETPIALQFLEPDEAGRPAYIRFMERVYKRVS